MVYISIPWTLRAQGRLNDRPLLGGRLGGNGEHSGAACAVSMCCSSRSPRKDRKDFQERELIMAKAGTGLGTPTQGDCDAPAVIPVDPAGCGDSGELMRLRLRKEFGTR